MEWELNRNRIAWGLLGVVVAIVAAIVVLDLVGTLGFAVFLYYALRPAHDRFKERFDDHPDIAPTLSLLLVGVPFLLITGYTGLVTAQQACHLITTRQLQWATPYLRPYTSGGSCIDPQSTLTHLAGTPGGANSVSQQPGRVADRISTLVRPVLKVLVRTFIVVVVAFYLLRDDAKISTWLRKSFDYDSAVMEFTEGVDHDLEHIFYGNLLTIVVTTFIAVGVNVSLDMLVPGGHVARPVLIGLATGVAVIIPIVGMKIVYLPYTAWLVFRATRPNAPIPVWFPVLYFVVTFILVDTIPDFWIRSYLSAGDLTLGMIMSAYVLGTVVFGWAGLFIGPIVLTVGYHFADSVFPKLVAGHSV